MSTATWLSTYVFLLYRNQITLLLINYKPKTKGYHDICLFALISYLHFLQSTSGIKEDHWYSILLFKSRYTNGTT